MSLNVLKYIGNFAQPTELLASWKQDGCNLFVICPEGSDKLKWRAECRRLNVQYIDTPSSDPKLDISDPWFLGWALPDEPRTLRGTRVGTEVVDYRTLCARLYDASPRHKLWGTFAGMDITAAYPAYKGEKDMAYFGQNEAVDRLTDIACDWYPKNRDGVKYPNSFVERQQALVQLWTKGTRRYWNVLECSDQCLKEAPARQIGGPTRVDMLEQAALTVAAGCEGLVYFSTAPQGPWGWDKTKVQNNFDSRTSEQKATVREIVAKYLSSQKPDPIVDPEWKTKYEELSKRSAELELNMNRVNLALKALKDNLGGL